MTKLRLSRVKMILAQVRSGHCLQFKAYKHLLNAADDWSCPRCEGLHTLEHWNVPEPKQYEWIFWQNAPTIGGTNRWTRKGCADVTACPIGQPWQCAYQTSINNSNTNNNFCFFDLIDFWSSKI